MKYFMFSKLTNSSDELTSQPLTSKLLMKLKKKSWNFEIFGAEDNQAKPWVRKIMVSLDYLLPQKFHDFFFNFIKSFEVKGCDVYSSDELVSFENMKYFITW